MMIKMIRIITILILAFLNNQAFANEIKKTCDKNDWSCHESFFVTGGYVFDHALLTNNQLSLALPPQPTIFYTPQNNFPNNCSGIRLGFGSGLSANLPFGYELDYQQVFNCSNTQNNLGISTESKSLVASFGYTINPKNRLNFSVFGGASVSSTYTTTTVTSLQFSQTTNSVDVDPFLGGALAYQINSRVALRAVELFNFAPYNKNSDGSFTTLLMLNYFPW